jgi:hypothetical protein
LDRLERLLHSFEKLILGYSTAGFVYQMAWGVKPLELQKLRKPEIILIKPWESDKQFLGKSNSTTMSRPILEPGVQNFICNLATHLQF